MRWKTVLEWSHQEAMSCSHTTYKEIGSVNQGKTARYSEGCMNRFGTDLEIRTNIMWLDWRRKKDLKYAGSCVDTASNLESPTWSLPLPLKSPIQRYVGQQRFKKLNTRIVLSCRRNNCFKRGQIIKLALADWCLHSCRTHRSHTSETSTQRRGECLLLQKWK